MAGVLSASGIFALVTVLAVAVALSKQHFGADATLLGFLFLTVSAVASFVWYQLLTVDEPRR